MAHILVPKSHVSVATLVRLLLAMSMKILNRECGPLRPNFSVFAILGQVWNIISPLGKGPSQGKGGILVAFDRGSIALGLFICSSSLARVLQLTVRATLPNFAFLAVFCPVAGPSSHGTVSSQCDSQPNPDARDQRGYQGP